MRLLNWLNAWILAFVCVCLVYHMILIVSYGEVQITERSMILLAGEIILFCVVFSIATASIICTLLRLKDDKR